MTSLGPGWVKSFEPEDDGHHLILHTWDPVTRTDAEIRISQAELETMSNSLIRRSRTVDRLQELADRIGLAVGEEKPVDVGSKPYTMRRVQ